MKPGSFRNWLRIKWEEHKIEFEAYEGSLPGYDCKAYFSTYKYWLVREFKHEMRGKNEKCR